MKEKNILNLVGRTYSKNNQLHIIWRTHIRRGGLIEKLEISLKLSFA
jgi:hypothetical protein